MATVSATVDDEGEIRPLTLPVSTQALTPSSMPVVQLIHRGEHTIVAPGAGNDGFFALRCVLPGNWIWVLQKWNASAIAVPSGYWEVASWVITPTINQDETPAAANQIVYPVGSRDFTGVIGNRRHYTIGAVGDEAGYQSDGMNAPDLALYGGAGVSLDPRLILEEPTAGLTADVSLTWFFLWNGYPLEQGLSSEFHASIPEFSR